MFFADPLFCCIQDFELEFVHNEGDDNLQYHKHDDEETHKVNPNQPTSFDPRCKPFL